MLRTIYCTKEGILHLVQLCSNLVLVFVLRI